jgi:hypothetical protein
MRECESHHGTQGAQVVGAGSCKGIDLAREREGAPGGGIGPVRLGLRNGTEWGRDGGCTVTVSKPRPGWGAVPSRSNIDCPVTAGVALEALRKGRDRETSVLDLNIWPDASYISWLCQR